jgi:rhodanese-related sulfurtransferase
MKMNIFEKYVHAKRFTFTGSALLSLLVFSGCEFGKKKEKEPTLLVVNVLAKELYDDCHIPGSIQVDFEKISEVAKGWPKSAKIVVYCANYACTASASAARDLKAQGFDAYEYAAGTAGWLQAGLPVVGNAQSPYLHQANEQHPESTIDVPMVSTEELKQLLDKEESVGKK